MSTKAKQVGVEVRAQAVKLGVWPCCLNCEHWTKLEKYCPVLNMHAGASYCGKYSTVPPDETIVVGCNQHIPYIPF